MGGRRVARAVVLAAVLGWGTPVPAGPAAACSHVLLGRLDQRVLGWGTTVTAGTAAAAEPPLANASFVSAGVQVYPLDAVGPTCQLFAFCDGAAEALAESAVPRYLSTRAGEAVYVDCQASGVARGVGFCARGQTTTTGWANTTGLQMRGAPARPCDVLS